MGILNYVMLFWLCSTLQCARFEVFSINSSTSSCDGEFTCYTLEMYATDNPSHSGSITLELQPGTHYLTSSLTLGNDVSSFTIRAIDTASVSCGPSACFGFSDLQQVTASGITFFDCKMELMNVTNATFTGSSFMKVTGYLCCKMPCVCPLLDICRTSVQIERCIFSNTNALSGNQAIVLYDGSIQVHNSSFNGFVVSCSGFGGAIYASRVEATIVNSSFCNNEVACGGGAIYIHDGNLTVLESHFSNNSVETNGPGGAIHFYTGGILHIGESYFFNNAANGIGGTLYVNGGNLSLSKTHFINSRAVNNGGAIYLSNGEVQIVNSHFANNIAGSLGGGALYIYDGKVAIINSSFSNNSANMGGRCGAVCTDGGNGLYILSSNFSNNSVNDLVNSNGFFSGGALYIHDNERVNITNCYFRNNAAVPGNFNGGAMNVYQGNIVISNSFFINNNIATDARCGGNTLFMAGGDLTIVYSYFCNENHEFDYIYYFTSSSNITIAESYFIINEIASSCLRDHLPDGIINNSSMISTTNVSTATDHNNNCENTNTAVITSCNNDGASTTTDKETLATSKPTSESELQTTPNTKEASESATQETTTMMNIITTTVTVMTMMAGACCRCCSCCPCCR